MSDRAFITDLAREFHETRQRLAPAFGVLVLGEKFDPESPIGELLIAVIEKIADRIDAERHDASHLLQLPDAGANS